MINLNLIGEMDLHPLVNVGYLQNIYETFMALGNATWKVVVFLDLCSFSPIIVQVWHRLIFLSQVIFWNVYGHAFTSKGITLCCFVTWQHLTVTHEGCFGVATAILDAERETSYWDSQTTLVTKTHNMLNLLSKVYELTSQHTYLPVRHQQG